MVEIKLSQGAKPGHGGVLPAAKVSPEIAAARGVPIGRDCISPAWHSEFSTPRGLLEFIERNTGASHDAAKRNIQRTNRNEGSAFRGGRHVPVSQQRDLEALDQFAKAFEAGA